MKIKNVPDIAITKARYFYELLILGWSLLINTEKQRLLGLCVFAFLSGLLEIVAITAMIPGIAILVDTARQERFFQLLSQNINVQFLHPDHLVFTVIFLLAILIAISCAISITLRFTINSFSSKCRTRLAADLVKSFYERSFDSITDLNSSVISRQINIDVVRWGSDFVGRILSFAHGLAVLFFAIIAIFIVARAFGILTTIVSGLLVISLHIFIMKFTSGFTEREKEATNKLSVKITQFISGMRDIRLSANPQYFLKDLNKDFSTYSELQAKRNSFRQTSPAIIVALSQLLLIAIVFLLWSLETPTVTIIELSAFLGIIASRLVPAANRLLVDITGLWDFGPYVMGLTRLGEKHSRERLKPKAENIEFPKSWHRISLNNVYFSYSNSKNDNLKNINLNLEKGKFYVFIGPSGSGKTTTANLVAGLLLPHTGSLKIDQHTIASSQIEDWQSQVSYVPQKPLIIDGTVMENITFGAQSTDETLKKVMLCIENVGLGELIKNLPNGLYHQLGDGGSKLSGGQIQRISIARALFKNSSMFILDEATNALDTLNENKIIQLLEKLRTQGKTVILITHRMNNLTKADVVYIFEDGKVIGEKKQR